MATSGFARIGLGLALALSLSPGRALAEASAAPDPAQLAQQLSKQIQKGTHLTFAMWTPRAFWDASLRSSGAEAIGAPILSAFDPYVVFLVADADQKIPGQLSFASGEELRGRVRLVDAQGAMHEPLPWDDVSPELVQVLAMLKPMLSNMVGALGENLNAFVFAGKDAKGQPIADPLQSGRLILRVNEQELVWRLPIAALLKPRTCPKTGDGFPGDYVYCPYHGVKLTE